MIFDTQPEIIVQKSLIKIIDRGLKRTQSVLGQNFPLHYDPNDEKASQIILLSLPISENYRNIFSQYDKIGIGVASMLFSMDSFIGDAGASNMVMGIARIIPFGINGELIRRLRSGLFFFLRGQGFLFTRLTGGLSMNKLSITGEIQDVAPKLGEHNYKGGIIEFRWSGLIRIRTMYSDKIKNPIISLDIED